MGSVSYPEGSEWRRWDLHVHTPRSHLFNEFGDDFDAYAKVLFEKARESRIAVIGVTDYFTIDGYKELRELVSDESRLEDLLGSELAEYAKSVLLLPNLELRGDLIQERGGGQTRINYHVIFSDDLDPGEIEDLFLSSLKFSNEANPGGPDTQRVLNLKQLEDVGRTIKEDHAHFQNCSDLVAGMKNAYIPYERVAKTLSDLGAKFQNNSLLVLPADEDLSQIDWNDQGYLFRKIMIQRSQMIFSANPSTRSWALGDKDDPKKFLREFKSFKPCINGSDAHKFEDLFRDDRDRHLWIKGDPTFEGLRHLLHEPRHRLFMGLEPEGLGQIRARADRIVESVTFTRESEEKPDEIWFQGSVPFNPGLVAIIGRKGSGKSALADILGLLGEDASAKKDFSFLTQERFLKPKHGLGQLFRAELEWRSEETRGAVLNEEVAPGALAKIKYIPQNYLESICADVTESTQSTPFDSELKEVIFSHVQPEAKLSCRNLDELILHRTAEQEAKASRFQEKLRTEVADFVRLRKASSPDGIKHLEGQIKAKETELEAHEKEKPVLLNKPSTGPVDKQTEEHRNRLGETVTAIKTLEQELAEKQKAFEECNRKLVAARRLVERIENLSARVDQFYEDSREDEEVLSINVKDLVVLKEDHLPIEAIVAEQGTELKKLNALLDPNLDESIPRKRDLLSAKAAELREKLDEPTRLYEESLRAHSNWEAKRTAIIGSADVAGSLEGLRKRRENLEQAPEHEDEIRRRIDELSGDIFTVKLDLLRDYEELYSPVQEFIANHPVAKSNPALEFSASISVDGFVDKLLGMIDQSKHGSFQGKHRGRDRAKQLVASHDFGSREGLEAFLKELTELLRHKDGQGEGEPQIPLGSQLVKSVSIEEVYEFIFGLEYLRPKFQILWQEKELDELSPGERGTMLLVFFLLIDRSEFPLVIDQPEENLDNETISELLVPALKYAKDRRQVFIVTHNPNLAVVCDAEQIVHASIDKQAGNKITYKTGSIENPTITKLIVDVLEGTKPSFDLRDDKYGVLERVDSGTVTRSQV